MPAADANQEPTPKKAPPSLPQPTNLPAVNLAQRIAFQAAAIVAASLVLGFAFNAINPVGIRLGEINRLDAPTNSSPVSIQRTDAKP